MENGERDANGTTTERGREGEGGRGGTSDNASEEKTR